MRLIRLITTVWGALVGATLLLAPSASAYAYDNGIGQSCQKPFTVRYDSTTGQVTGDTDVIQLSVSGQTASWKRISWAVGCDFRGTASGGESWIYPGNTRSHTASGTIGSVTVTAMYLDDASPIGSSCNWPYQVGYETGSPGPEGYTDKILVSSPTPDPGPYSSLAWSTVSGVMMCTAYGTDSDGSGWSWTDVFSGSHTPAPGASMVRFILVAQDMPIPRDDITPPAEPTGFSGSAGDTSVGLSWNANTDPDIEHYNLYRQSGSDWVRVARVFGTSYTHSGLTNGQSYSYRLLAVDVTGNESAPSPALSFTPAPAPVVETPPGSVPGPVPPGDDPGGGGGMQGCPMGQLGTPPNCTLSAVKPGLGLQLPRFNARQFARGVRAVATVSGTCPCRVVLRLYSRKKLIGKAQLTASAGKRRVLIRPNRGGKTLLRQKRIKGYWLKGAITGPAGSSSARAG